MLKGNIILIVLLAVFSVSLWGCAGNLPEAQRIDYLNMNYGNSYESAINNQILNPDSEKNLEPVLGLDGQPAEYNANKYKKSFEKESEVTTEASKFNILEQGGGGQ